MTSEVTKGHLKRSQLRQNHESYHSPPGLQDHRALDNIYYSRIRFGDMTLKKIIQE